MENVGKSQLPTFYTFLKNSAEKKTFELLIDLLFKKKGRRKTCRSIKSIAKT